jgi:DNA-binding beta-propeller fold protein YncE
MVRISIRQHQLELVAGHDEQQALLRRHRPEHGRNWDPPAVLPEQDQLLLASYDGDAVIRYDAATGDFIDTSSPGTRRLNQPYGILIGPHDNDLYVSTGEFGGPGQAKAVLRFDGETGAFVETFTQGGNLESPRSIIFGPDGNLYVADKRAGGPGGRIARYDGRTGDYLGDFVPWQSGGLKIPTYLVFGPSDRGPLQLDLYVSNLADENVLRYDGATGAFLGVYVASRSGGLESPMD